MRRGEVWWANIPEPIGRRPVVPLIRNAAYPVRSSVRCCSYYPDGPRDTCRSTSRGQEDGLPENCVANLDNILTLSKKRLDRSLTILSPEKMRAIEQAIKFALDLR